MACVAAVLTTTPRRHSLHKVSPLSFQLYACLPYNSLTIFGVRVVKRIVLLTRGAVVRRMPVMNAAISGMLKKEANQMV